MSFHLFSSIVSFPQKSHNILFNIKTGLSSVKSIFFSYLKHDIYFLQKICSESWFFIFALLFMIHSFPAFFFENKNLYTSHPSRDSRKVWYMNHIKTSWKCSISKTCFANFFARFTRMKKNQINFSRRSEETNHATYYMYFLT